MNKKTLTTAIVAGITGVAGVVGVSNAVHVNPDGSGQVLIYPYYTVNNDNDTLISVVNTTSEAKALKVRFIEGMNSLEVRDFNLYLSPFDVWTAAITADDTFGGAKFITNDSSCTVPRFYDESRGTSLGGPFDGGSPEGASQTGFTAFSNALFPLDAGPNGLARTREGYVEIIEMGVVTNDDNNSAAAITHTPNADEAGGNLDIHGDPLPLSCEQINRAWTDIPSSATQDYWLNIDPQIDMDPPSGGLFGDLVVINVPGARAAGVSAVALEAFSDSSIHRDPATALPDLSSGTTTSNLIVANTSSDPFVVKDTWDTSAEAVSAALMTEKLMNQFATEASIAGETEWVVTFPTKRLHTFQVDDAIPPFTSIFPLANAETNPLPVAPEEISISIWDREENTPAGPGPGIVCPSPPVPFCTPTINKTVANWEVNVLTFQDAATVGSASKILGSTLFSNIDAEADVGETGWAELTFVDPDHQMVGEDSGMTYTGLPAIGFAIRTADNGAFQYGNAFEHVYSRKVQ